VRGEAVVVVDCRGAMGIAGALWRVETRVKPSVSFSIPARRRAVWPDGNLGSSNRPFSMKAPRADVSERESEGPDIARHRKAALEPDRLPPPEWCSSSLNGQLRPPRGAQSAVVRDYRALETGRRRANRLVLTVSG